MSDLGQTSRAANALLKRQEAVKRWKSSDTNREPAQRTAHQVRITFDRETVFLSAVSSGDVEETRNLLNDGVDINCANVDGLTALHQVIFSSLPWYRQLFWTTLKHQAEARAEKSDILGNCSCLGTFEAFFQSPLL